MVLVVVVVAMEVVWLWLVGWLVVGIGRGDCRRGTVCENQGERVQLGQRDKRDDVDAMTKNKKVKKIKNKKGTFFFFM